MSQTTRAQHLANYFRPERIPRAMAPRYSFPPVPPKTWTYDLTLDGVVGVTGVVTAHTRSEARAEIKRRHCLKRVPVGTVITEL